jgi:hypothetical protein
VTPLAVIWKVAEVAPERTETLAGTVATELLLESATTVFPETGAFRFTVQVAEAPLAIVAGLQIKDVTWVVAVTVTVIVVCAVAL